MISFDVKHPGIVEGFGRIVKLIVGLLCRLLVKMAPCMGKIFSASHNYNDLLLQYKYFLCFLPDELLIISNNK